MSFIVLSTANCYTCRANFVWSNYVVSTRDSCHVTVVSPTFQCEVIYFMLLPINFTFKIRLFSLHHMLSKHVNLYLEEKNISFYGYRCYFRTDLNFYNYFCLDGLLLDLKDREHLSTLIR